ncbi:Oar protein [Pseudoxanthomonas yeongjuensis]|uniref:TonB-dependent receptor n=1 Tax=Pseudoxanthomonas yeongjuensis TaxID=377616 RepID=UPI001390E353|nr:TonB-dependent receptor [Pseudoxanthomonas yeongjuensis]KAF1718268.1 Oar protein [Pseudoxanthomonas yeongjuensis]
MSKRTFNRALRRSALTVALGFCFNSYVHAQSNTSGAVFGQASAGETVLVENPATGFSRTISVGADGAYRVSALSPGTYRVTLKRTDGTTSAREVSVNVGTGTSVNFTAASSGGDGATNLGTVTVVASTLVNPIDVSSVESTTILTSAQLAKIPVPRDTTSVALLAPGTVRGDNAFGNLASFGGSSVAENQYYINGFNVTNSFRSLNFSKVPFEGIAEQQIKTGGYGAEFGRSLGGVVNQITKRGTNEFKAGANVFWAPKALRSDVENVKYSNPLEASDFGTVAEDNSKDTRDELIGSVWAGGALVQDRLFGYALLSYGQTDTDTWGDRNAFTNRSGSLKNPTWLTKFDWNINDSNKLELTAFSDKQETETKVYANTPGEVDRTAYAGTLFDTQGGDNYVLKYTGYLTDTFTLTALYGHGVFKRQQHLENPDGSKVSYNGDITTAFTTDINGTTALGGCPVILDLRPGYRQDITGTYGSYCNLTDGALLQASNNEDTRDQYRIDAEWILGPHQLRFGVDIDNYESVAGEANAGGWLWRYSTQNGPDGKPDTGDEVDVVRRQTTARGTTLEVKQQAYYIEDSWSITENFLAYLGARWDTFENLDATGKAFVKISNQFGPRLGFSWDVNGDSTLKIYGNAGRYALPLTPSVAVRGSSASIYQRSNNNHFSGVDPVTGAPILIGPLNPLNLINGEDGNAHDPLTIASKNLDPMYQDEFILGFQSAWTDHLNFGARAIYRKLKAAIDDNCDYTAITDLADADGLDYTVPNPGFPYCRLFNPGEDAVIVTDLNGDGIYTTYTVDGDRLSPQAKRSYKALELFLDGSWDKFFFQASYTLGYNKGNTEGGVKSDIGQGDTNTTQDFDYRELTVDTEGYLPNDRRHALKVFGNYDVSEEWSVGGNLLVQTGRPINCLGVLDQNPLLPEPAGTDPDGDGVFGESNYAPHPYGSGFMRCSNSPDGASNDTTVSAVPRGTAGRLPTTTTFDLNVAYRPSFAPGLQFKMDVFNVFNSQKVIAVSDVAEDSATGNPLNTYLLPRAYQAPRSFRFMVQYDF